jgi:hypothetical protein
MRSLIFSQAPIFGIGVAAYSCPGGIMKFKVTSLFKHWAVVVNWIGSRVLGNAGGAAGQRGLALFVFMLIGQSVGLSVARAQVPGLGQSVLQQSAFTPADYKACAVDPKGPGCTIILGSLPSSGNSACSSALSSFTTGRAKLSSGCNTSNLSSCIEHAQACAETDAQTGDDEMNSNSNSCDSIVSTGCKELNGGTEKDYKDSKKDIQSQIKDAKQTVLDTQAEQQKLQTEIAKTTLDFNKQQAANDKALRDGQQAAEKALTEGMSSISKGKQEAYQKARDAYDQIDQAYMKLRGDVRNDAMAIQEATNAMEQGCRDDAYAKYTKSEQDLQAKMDLENAKIKNVGSITTFAGNVKRNVRQNQRTLDLNYANFYGQCMSGSVPPGSTLKKAIATAKNAQKVHSDNMVDQGAYLEKKRNDVLTSLKQMESEATTQQQTLIKAVQQNLTNLNSDYTTQGQNLIQQSALTRNDLNSQANNLTQKMNNQSQDLSNLNGEMMSNDLRLNCATKYGGSKSSSSGDNKIKAINDAQAGMGEVQAACYTLGSTQCVSTTPDGIKNACETLTKNIDRATGVRSSR